MYYILYISLMHIYRTLRGLLHVDEVMTAKSMFCLRLEVLSTGARGVRGVECRRD